MKALRHEGVEAEYHRALRCNNKENPLLRLRVAASAEQGRGQGVGLPGEINYFLFMHNLE